VDYLNKYYTHLKNLKIGLGSGINPKEGFIGIDNFIGIKVQTITPNIINKINKFVTFNEARLFLFNCCWQMQLICKKVPAVQNINLNNIEYNVVPYGGTISRSVKRINKDFTKILRRIVSSLNKQ
jgi:hypothetical protein